MKHTFINIGLMLLCLISETLFAQGPPDPGGSPVFSSPPLGGGAPIGNGTMILLALGVVYSILKMKSMNWNFIKRPEIHCK